MYYKITNLSTWPPWVHRSTPEKSDSNDTKCSYVSHFLDFENNKMRKKTSDFRLMSIKAVCEKHPASFRFPDDVQCQ